MLALRAQEGLYPGIIRKLFDEAFDELRGTENQKIHCGERHFVGALGVDYKAIKPDAPLPLSPRRPHPRDGRAYEPASALSPVNP